MPRTDLKFPAQTLPHSLEAEKTVLGALLLDPDAIHSISQSLAANDFYDPVYKTIFQACTTLHAQSKPIDFVTVSETLANEKSINDIGGSAFLADLANSVPTSSHATHYAEIVHQLAKRRAVITAGKRIYQSGFDANMPIDDVTDLASQAILNLTPSTDHVPEIAVAIHSRRYEAVAELQANPQAAKEKNVYTGFEHLDFMLGGLTPSTLTVLAARPAMGKSSLALNIALNAAEKGSKKTLLFTTEMTKESTLDRVASSRIGIPFRDIQTGNIDDDQLKQYGDVYNSLQQVPLYIDDDPDCSITNFRNKAKHHQIKHGLDFIIVDYIQEMSVPRSELRDDSLYRKVSFISAGIKQLARELSIPIIALSQLSRAVEQRPDKRPVLSDLRESGSIEQDATNVLMLYREDYYVDAENNSEVTPGLTNVFIRKQRNGPTGVVDLMFNKERLQFASFHKSSLE